MTAHLRAADLVLMVCTETYYRRVMGEEKPGTGRGVTWEGNLIFQYLSEADTVNRRFVPMLFEDANEAHIPDPLRPFTHYRIQGEAGYTRLYRRLSNQPEVKAPALGKLKPLPPRERRQDVFREPPHNIPLPGPAEFVGRAGALRDLDQQLKANGRPIAITSVVGMGGVGKTELVGRYARSRLNVYPGGVCWAKIRGGDLGSQILTFAQVHLGLVPPDTLTEASVRVEYCWAHWPGDGQVLLVLDDVTAWKAVQPFLPKSRRFDTVITSRKHFAGVETLDLGVLLPEASLALLESLIGTERCAAQRKEAQLLCEWLGHLPLGLELVGRYLGGKQDLPLAEMRARLETKGLAHSSIQPGEGQRTAERGVAAAFELSWEDLDEPGRELGCLLSLFALAPIPWNVVEGCWPERDMEELEDVRDTVLINASLLQRKGEGFYQLHQLVREFLRDKLTSWGKANDLRKAFAATLARAACEVPQTPTLNTLNAFTSLVPHWEELTEHQADALGDEDLVWPFVALQRIYGAQNIFSKAIDWAKKGLSAAEERSGPEHPDVATNLDNLAGLYLSQGRYAEAEPLYRQALEILEQALDPAHPTSERVRANLAQLRSQRS